MLVPFCCLVPSLQNGQDGGDQPGWISPGFRSGASALAIPLVGALPRPAGENVEDGQLVKPPVQAAGWQLSLFPPFLRDGWDSACSSRFFTTVEAVTPPTWYESLVPR